MSAVPATTSSTSGSSCFPRRLSLQQHRSSSMSNIVKASSSSSSEKAQRRRRREQQRRRRPSWVSSCFGRDMDDSVVHDRNVEKTANPSNNNNSKKHDSLPSNNKNTNNNNIASRQVRTRPTVHRRTIVHRRRSTGSTTTQLYSSDEEELESGAEDQQVMVRIVGIEYEVTTAAANADSTPLRPRRGSRRSSLSHNHNSQDDESDNEYLDLQNLEQALRRRSIGTLTSSSQGPLDVAVVEEQSQESGSEQTNEMPKEAEDETQQNHETASQSSNKSNTKHVRFLQASSQRKLVVAEEEIWPQGPWLSPAERSSMYWTPLEIRAMQYEAKRAATRAKQQENNDDALLLRSCLELAHDWHTANVTEQREQHAEILSNEQSALHYYNSWRQEEHDNDDDATTLRGLEHFICPCLEANRLQYRRQLVQEWQPRYGKNNPEATARGLATQSRRATVLSQRFAQLVGQADAATAAE